MRGTYGEVLSLPGAAAFSATGLVARFPLSMAALGIVLLITETTDGGYLAASLVSGCYIAAAAALAPVQGRLGDRWGQRWVLVATGAGFAVGMTALLVAVSTDAPTPVPHLCAMVAGVFTPQAGSFVRARWTWLLRERRERLTTAFAIEAVLDEVVFVVGPVLVTVLTIQVAGVAGLATATAAATLGSWALALQTSTEPGRSRRHGVRREPMRWDVLGPVLVAAVGIGVLFGSSEVLVVAFADEQGRKSLSGVVLAVWAMGSLVAGVVVGALPAPPDPVARLRWALLALALSFAPLLVAPDLWWLTAGMFVAGVMISPTMIAATSVVELHVPPSRLTEALTWTSTGLAVGVAPGSVLAGSVVDAQGASAGFAVPLVAGLLAAAVAWGFRPPDVPDRDLVTDSSAH